MQHSHYGVHSAAKRLKGIMPLIFEDSYSGERALDVYSRLLKDRIVFLTGPITENLSSLVTAQLLYLEAENPTRNISLYINSPGGSVSAGLAIYDTMQFIECPVSTICVGQAASMASLLLCGGTKGLRHSLPNSRIMVHQPSGGVKGMASDIAIHADEILKLRSRLNELFVKHTTQQITVIEKMMDRDKFLSAENAIALGLIDEILHHRRA